MELHDLFDALIEKAVKKTQHVPTTEQGARRVLRQEQQRAERGHHHNPVSKGDGEEDFRGGDPVDMEIKKEEKELSKAQPGEEAGAFRGGDPEEIRIKREEKMQELEDSGAFEDADDGGGEEVTQEEIEEAQEEDAQKKEDQGKSLMSKASQILSSSIFPNQQVSPVDTFGEYQPRDANGDLLSQKYGGSDEARARTQDYVAPAPPRAGENQHKNWSEILGFKIPLSGEPLQHLRRYWKQGQHGQMSKEAELLARSLEGETGILWCWNPDFHGGKFYKGLESAPKPGHKYIKRWFEGGKWQYEYTDQMHAGGSHGIQHTGKMGGHTLDIHPSTPHKKMSPEEAYNYSRHMQIADGGSYPVQMFDKKANRVVDKIIHMPGAKRDKDGNYILDKKTGLPDINFRGSIQIRAPGAKSAAGAKRFTDAEAFDRAMTRSQVTTEYDAHGDPWIHWRPGGKGAGRPSVMYDPRSRMNKDNPDSGKGFIQSKSKDLDNFREWVANQKALQRAMKDEDERGHVSPEERKSAKDWEPTFHHVYDMKTLQKQKDENGKPVKAEMKMTNALERGDLGVWKWKQADVPREVKDEYGNVIRRVWEKGPELHFDNIHDRNKVMAHILHENYAPLVGQARSILRTANLLDSSNPDETQRKIQELVHHGFGEAFERAANTYNPNHSSGARFSTYLIGAARGKMQDHLPRLLDEREQNRALALRDHSKMSQRAEHLQRLIETGQAKADTKKQLSDLQEQIQSLESAYSLVPRGGKVGKEQKLRAKVEPTEVTAQPSTSEGKKQLAGGRAEMQGLGASETKMSPETRLAAKQELQKEAKEDPSLLTKPEDQLTADQYENLLAAEGLGAIKSLLFQDLVSAVGVLRKAEEEFQEAPQPAMKYLWREGEPGAYKYMWEDPKGNVVRGTNAPEDHPHHDPEAGPSQIHPHEPHPDRDTYMFDAFGRKLHRPAPEGAEVEHNINYDPDVNHWVQKYRDQDTGAEEFIALHSDRSKNHRYSHNEDLRQVDAQLEKVRQWYDQMFQAEDLRTKAMGLAMALVDQAKILADGEGSGLLSMRVKDVKMMGNGFQFSYKDSYGDSHTVNAVLDSSASAVLQALAQGKKPGDLLFDVEGQPVSQMELAQALDNQFGLSLKQFRVYHGTELFSKVFQQIVSTYKDLKPEDLHKISDQACARVMRMLGHKKVDPSVAKQLYIDPIVVEALFMSAIHHHDDEINKSIEELLKGRKLHGRCTFQGLPVSIENRKGSTRSWYDPHNKQPGTTKMKFAYGYIRGTKGTDGDHVDVYLGPDKNSDKVFVVHQRKAPDFKEFDEDKCLLGFPSGKEAKEAYMGQYDNPKFFGGMTVMSMEDFKRKILETKDHPRMIKGWTPGAPNIPSPTNASQKSNLRRDAAHALVNHQLHAMRGNHDEAKTWHDHAYRLSKIAGAGPTKKMMQGHVKLWQEEHASQPSKYNAENLAAAQRAVIHPLVGSKHVPSNPPSGSVSKSSEIRLCSKCLKGWGECSHSQEVEKSFAGSADTGPVVWHVSVSHPERTPDEKMFGDWIHGHPMHEHDQHWAAFKQATKVDGIPDPIHGREYATGHSEEDEDAGDFDLEEADYTDVVPGRAEDQIEEGKDELPPREMSPDVTAKSLVEEMIRLAS